eukprot:188538-Hanusia_phi.AAC.1
MPNSELVVIMSDPVLRAPGQSEGSPTGSIGRNRLSWPGRPGLPARPGAVSPGPESPRVSS